MPDLRLDRRTPSPSSAELSPEGETAAEDATIAEDEIVVEDEQRAEAEQPADAERPADAEQLPAFGEQTPHRFAADVEYSGSTGRHDYLVRVRHRLLDTTFTVVIDGIEHDPKAEIAARPPEGADEEGADPEAVTETKTGAAAGPEADPEDDPKADGSADAEPGADDDLRFSLQDGFATLVCTVRRPKDGGGYKNAEEITIRTSGLGGAGEVDLRHGFKRIPLVPEEGSPSAARDAKRTAHPTRYALVAATMKSARYLVPLLGLGALFSGLLDPLLEWAEAKARPALDAIARITAPVREWIGQLLRPIQEFLASVFSPIREFFAWLLRPVRDLLDWLLGLLPDFGLPFDIPDWLLDVLVPVIVVVAVFSGTYEALQSRGERLAAAKAARAANVAGTGGGASPAPGARTDVVADPSDPDVGSVPSAPSPRSSPSADGREPSGATAAPHASEDEGQR